MRRIPSLPRGLTVATLVIGAAMMWAERLPLGRSSAQATTAETPRSWPPDLTPYAREATAEEQFAALQGAGLPPAIFVRDVVVSNTDATLNANDTNNDGETSIGINPLDPDEITITAFSGGWGANAPVWHSTDGGVTWTKRFTIPVAPGLNQNCPCDQAVDFDSAGNMSATFLVQDPNDPPGDPFQTEVVSGITPNVANGTSWLWNVIGGLVQFTNAVAQNPGNVDQPWLLANRDPATGTQDNVYVAYDDFNGGPDMRVSVAFNSNQNPTAALNFTQDVQVGASGGGGINPGLRLAKDPRTGFMYALWQRCVGNCGGNPKSIEYRLNRTMDGGATWPLGGGAGIVVATADSTQPTPKFGTVNALLGGVLHASVDPNTGEVYYAYGDRDSVTGNDRLSMRRISFDVAGNPIVNAPHFITGQVEAAIPSVAVASDGTVGVFHYTFDGFSSDAFPIFSAHVAFSRDKGVTFTTRTMQTFLSSAMDSGDARQRVLGDYMQMKTVGRTFYGAYTGNGLSFGRPFANHDPIFFKATVGPRMDTRTTANFGDVCRGDSKTTQLQIFNTGIDDLIITSVTRVSGSTDISVTNGPITPTVVSPDAHVDFDITCTPTSFGSRTAVIRVESDDPDRPQFDITYTCNAPEPDVKVTGSTTFGDVCAGTLSEQTVSVCNVGACNLNVLSVTSSCPDFTVVNNPFPAPVSKDFCMPVVVRFTPTSDGPKTCTLTITTDDPQTPVIQRTLTGNTPAPSIDVPYPAGQSFVPGVIQSTGMCEVPQPFPISNTGRCPLTITAITVGGPNAGDFSLSGLPSFPIILEPGHIAGEGDLKTVFAATALDRDRLGAVTVTYVSDPVTGATTQVTRNLCGEGVLTGARVLVVNGAGVPYATVEAIQLQRINANRNRQQLDTVDSSRDLPLVNVAPAAPCQPFSYHKEYGTVSNPIQLLPGSYNVTATVISSATGKRTRKTVGFDVQTCTFNQNIVIIIP